MEPSAVTIQESKDIAPTCAMFAGSMMMPEPIMFTHDEGQLHQVHSFWLYLFRHECSSLVPCAGPHWRTT